MECDQIFELRKTSMLAALSWSKCLMFANLGVVVFSLIFFKDLLIKPLHYQSMYLISYCCFIISFIFGLITQGALIATLSSAKFVRELDVYSSSARAFAIFQVLWLLIGFIFFSTYISCNLHIMEQQ